MFVIRNRGNKTGLAKLAVTENEVICMEKTYEIALTLRSCDCDINGRWRPGAILEALQEAAGAHSLLLGCGRDELLKQNAVWVLSRLELHMERYPAFGETVKVMTFPMPVRMFFFPRYFVLTDAHGEMIGKAGSLWLLMDIHTRKMLPPGEVARLIPNNRDLTVPMNLPATVGAIQGEEFVTTWQPVYTDLDVNHHVNNTKYVDWLCNELGVDCMIQNELESVIVNYHHEILPGQTVVLRRIMKDGQYHLSGYVEEQVAFEIGGTLRPRG